MEALNKTSDPQTCVPYKPLAYEARENYERFITDVNGTLYEQLVECIRIVSSRGAKGLDVYCNVDSDSVEQGRGYAYLDTPDGWFADRLVSVHISVPSLVDWEALAKRLECEKLMVTWTRYVDDGDAIDTIAWINIEE